MNESENVVDILAKKYTFVHTNVTLDSIVNDSKDSVIYSFFPENKIIQRPTNPIYLPVSTNSIWEFYIKLTDQNNNLLDIRKILYY